MHRPVGFRQALETDSGGLASRASGSAGEEGWIEVIRKMDEVYNELLQYEVALEQKNAALEETQQFLYSVLGSMTDLLVICDRTGRIQDVNAATTRLLGRSEEDLRGTPIASLLADDESRGKMEAIFARSRVDPVTDCEVVFRSEDAQCHPASINCAPRFNNVGKAVGVVLAGRPIGELRRAYHDLHEAHQELKEAQQQLLHAEKMASLGRLVAGVAHELNNPISFVLGNAHSLMRYTARLKRYLDAVHEGTPRDRLEEMRRDLRIDRILGDLEPLMAGTVEGAERARDIVDGLKRFSAMGKEESKRFSLTEVVATAVRWVIQARRQGFVVESDLPPDLPVRGSPGQLQQVVINLAQNAADATAGVAKPRLTIRGEIHHGQILVTFRDNGPGMDEAVLGKVFDPFFTTKPVGKGTGLGLSISYGIVERHGGRLAVANHPDGGALFTLTLPLAGI
jgi:two-component system sensor histidine kinase HupT/HoxJ